MTWLTRLVGAHGPTSILLIWCNGNQVGIVGGKLTLASSLLDNSRRRRFLGDTTNVEMLV